MKNSVKTCPVCESSSLRNVLTRHQVPVHQNLLINDQNSAMAVNRGDLTLVICTECGFIFNQTFDSSKLGFGELYDSTQDISPAFINHLSERINHLIDQKNVRNKSIVEIGSGQGSFLRKLVEVKEWNNVGHGFDPSYRGPEIDLDGHLQIERRFFDSSCTKIPADIIICRQVLDHIPNPIDLLSTIRQVLIPSPNVRVFFETFSVEWPLENQVIWNFFYEYCSYFSTQSLTTAFEIAGFKVEEVQPVFRNQYLWLEASISTEKSKVTKKPEMVLKLAEQFSSSFQTITNNWKEKIQGLSSHGKVALWGAGAKGTTLANLADPKREWIDCIIDINPNKQGKYVAGTGHPIVNHKEIIRRGIKNIVLMNPNYHQEVADLLKNESIDVMLVHKI